MNDMNHFLALPEDLPEPQDDGQADHLLGKWMPSINLTSIDDNFVNLYHRPAR
jgi:hypothetical protein